MTKYNESEQFIASLVADHPDDCARMVEALARYGITRTVEQVAEAYNEFCENYVSAAWLPLEITKDGGLVAHLLATELAWADGEVTRLGDEARAANARVEALLTAVREIDAVLSSGESDAKIVIETRDIVRRVIGGE